MIVYAVSRSFFAMKEDADRHRKSLGLKPADLHKIQIENRDELAKLLNSLIEAELMAFSLSINATTPQQAAAMMPTPEPDEFLQFVPSFIKADWERRRKARSGQ